MSVVSVNERNFDSEVLQSTLPVLIDFWAPWCGPCKMFSPVVDEVAERQQGKLKVCKVNIDEEPGLAQRFGVMSIPTVALIRGGKLEKTSVGYRTREQLEEML
ncbi:thioredoxin [Feifania hominis]|uniref:Thioredoxin n=1 Tax=Feifania hominis TaxID=2763660 RepID=A0A926DDD4_9FIRM|nr:thioredoxin [Feifania hominis]